MKLKRKTKRKLRIALAILMILIMLLPLAQYFFPAQPDINDALMEAYIESMKNAEQEEEIPLQPELEGTYIVTEVIDGDTICVMWGEEERQLDLIGVKAPEVDSNNGKEATSYLKKLIGDQLVALEFDVVGENENGQLLAYAYLENMTQINELLISEGWAYYEPDEKNTKYNDNFELAQNVAERDENGLWSDKNRSNIEE